ncbi:MAG: oligosaccharide flippase family protein [Candidatus Omnitrophota bacterium]
MSIVKDDTKPRAVDSVGKRYFVTLFSNAVFFFVSLVTAGIVPRALGPKQLGDFSFLMKVSTALRNFLNLGTSSAFFNYNSKHEKTGPLVKAYSVWLVGQLLITLSLVGFAVMIGISSFIWPGQGLKYIIWVLVFDWVFFSVSTLKQLSDSKGFTRPAQIISLCIGLLNIAVLVYFALNGLLNLGRYIAIQTICSATISLSIIFWIIIPNRNLYWEGRVKGKLKEFFDYFYKFCSPLVAILLVGLVFEYFDRMILQRFSGSINQGYFHIASSWAAFATLFTTSILAIYNREMASSIGKHDTARASSIFSRFLKIMYFLTLLLAVFLAFHAKQLLGLIAGPKFLPATTVVVIMAFYPIHQVYGQLGGTAFYATERTAQLRNISVIAMISGIPLTYYFLAPKNFAIPGLELGALGLALKTVIWQFVVVQVYLVYNCRFFKIRPGHFWWHQIYCGAILASVMYLLKAIVGFFLKDRGTSLLIARLVTEMVIYFAVIAGLVYLFPKIAGTDKEEIRLIFKKVKGKLGFAHR